MGVARVLLLLRLRTNVSRSTFQGEVAMKKLVLASLIGTAFMAAPVQAQLLPTVTPYLSFSDSPFASMSFSTFYLEDVEDGAINTTGLTVTAAGNSLCIAGTNCFVGSGLIDSVGNGGNGNVGHSIFGNGPIVITFDSNALGGFPTAAGLVWTDGNNPVTFEAFDENNVSLGTITISPATAGFDGETDEDTFFGAINAGGISMLTINNPPSTEIDHIQYGFLAQIAGVPEPGTWAMMLLGFGAVGCALRRRRSPLQQA
jgi:hypothetical protein